jgi:hypothetical protein
MGFDFADAFADGGVDYYCTDLPHQLFQHWEAALGSYANATWIYGLQGGGGSGWACHFLDFDNDAWQDLFVVMENVPNLLFRNPALPAAAQVPWPNVANTQGLAQAFRQYAAVTADFDDDGRVDVLQRFHVGGGWPQAPVGLALFRNQVAGGNWLRFVTEGTSSNRDGFGTRIEVTTGAHHQRQWVRSGTGYAGGADRRVHFGLGTATSVDRVTLTWPSGQRQFLTGVPANQTLRVVEPRMTVAGPAPVGGSTTITATIPGDEGLQYLMVLSITANQGLTLPNGAVVPVDFDGLTALTMAPGNPVLPGSVGVLDAAGVATSAMNVPPLAFLSGLTVYAGMMTFDAPSFPWVRTVIAARVPVSIQ